MAKYSIFHFYSFVKVLTLQVEIFKTGTKDTNFYLKHFLGEN